MAGSRERIAHVEDVDEDDNILVGSQRYAKSTIASAPGSPIKQQMNTGRKKASRRIATTSPDESDSTEQASSSSRHKNGEKRPSRGSRSKDVLDRPAARTVKTAPAPRRHDDPSYYGVTQHISSSSARPRAASRPQSYYGPTPPLSNSAYYGARPQMHPNPVSYPAPPWLGPLPGSSPLGSSPLANSTDYFSRGQSHDPLASRFARPEQRPRSSMGHRVGSFGSGFEEYDAPPPPERHVNVTRQPSLKTRPLKEHEDRRRMPPPSRPSTTQPRQIFKPPALQPQHKKSVGFNEDDLDGESDYYRHEPRRTSIDFLKDNLPIRSNRRQSLGPEYYGEQYALELAASKSKREKRRSTSYGMEDKVKNASQYQAEVVRDAPQALTPENLRRHKNGGSSRSTRSSASRDESSFRHSATTKTTRSGSNDDDITIKVPNGAVVEVGNAKINCTNGGEINIGRGNGGSDRDTVYGDELRSRGSRAERPSTRTRTSSQSAHSRHPRALPSPYPDHAANSYGYQASEYNNGYIPPYPAYPRTNYGFDNDLDSNYL